MDWSKSCQICKNQPTMHTMSQRYWLNRPYLHKLPDSKEGHKPCTLRYLRFSLQSTAPMGDVDILFGPQSQMPHINRILWTVTRGHMLWTIWSLRISSRRHDNQPDPPTPQHRTELLAEYSFLSNLLKHIRILRYSDKARTKLWDEYQKAISFKIQSLMNSLPEATGAPVSIQTAITDFFAVIRPTPNP